MDWLPDHCIDDELIDEFDRAGPGPNGSWLHFADKDGSVAINDREIDDYVALAIDYFITGE